MGPGAWESRRMWAVWEAGAGREGWSQGAGVEAEGWDWCRLGAREDLVGHACAGVGRGGGEGCPGRGWRGA